MSPYIPLSIAIVAEVIATTAMKSSDNFTRLVPSVIVVVGYVVAFYFLSITLKFIPTGIAYAIWPVLLQLDLLCMRLQKQS